MQAVCTGLHTESETVTPLGGRRESMTEQKVNSCLCRPKTPWKAGSCWWLAFPAGTGQCCFGQVGGSGLGDRVPTPSADSIYRYPLEREPTVPSHSSNQNESASVQSPVPPALNLLVPNPVQAHLTCTVAVSVSWFQRDKDLLWAAGGEIYRPEKTAERERMGVVSRRHGPLGLPVTQFWPMPLGAVICLWLG